MATSESGRSHEGFAANTTPEASSDRAFGFVFAAVFAIVAAWPHVFGGAPRWWAVALAVAFAGVAIAAPRVLAPLNRAWARVGAFMHAVVSPVVLSIIFYGVVWPTAALMRVRSRDPLKLRLDRSAGTYWVHRTPPGPPPASFRDPF